MNFRVPILREMVWDLMGGNNVMGNPIQVMQQPIGMGMGGGMITLLLVYIHLGTSSFQLPWQKYAFGVSALRIILYVISYSK